MRRPMAPSQSCRMRKQCRLHMQRQPLQQLLRGLLLTEELDPKRRRQRLLQRRASKLPCAVQRRNIGDKLSLPELQCWQQHTSSLLPLQLLPRAALTSM